MIEIVEAFNICHDGRILHAVWHEKFFEFEIEIEYLTSRIENKPRRLFFEIFNASEFSLLTWPRDFSKKPENLVKIEKIFEFPLDILDAEIKDGFILVNVNVEPFESNFCGGNLRFKGSTIKIRSSNGEEISLKKLDNICQEYWREWALKNKKSENKK